MTGHPHRSPDRRCKTIDQWPATDRDIWLAALRAGDVLENGGELSHRSASTILEYARGYGRWLTWLDCSGCWTGRSHPPTGLRRVEFGTIFKRWRGITPRLRSSIG